jgi:hypothetical protein
MIAKQQQETAHPYLGQNPAAMTLARLRALPF